MVDSRTARDRNELKTIVRQASEGLKCEIFLFGSRARGTAMRKSDFDIGVRGLNQREFGILKCRIEDLYEDSRIIVGIDIIDLESSDNGFRVKALEGAQRWK